MAWEDKTTVKKGDYAEALVDKILERNGYIMYFPKTNGPHAFDRLAIKNKEKALIVEVKAKAARNRYPDTGIDIRHYEGYKKIRDAHDLPVLMMFVDEQKGEIYGNLLKVLEEENVVEHNRNLITYPVKQHGIIYFPLALMKTFTKLTDKDIKFLKGHNTRNYEYK